MLGYCQDAEATASCTFGGAEDASGWFRTGDLAVVHPDGYLEIRDRSKDIISSGENTSSVGIDRALDGFPAVLQSAVDRHAPREGGEVPVAFVTVHPDASVDDEKVVAFVRSRLAGFEMPRRFVHAELPKMSAG